MLKQRNVRSSPYLTRGTLQKNDDNAPMRTFSKNIISRYCNNFVITLSRPEWEVFINIAGRKKMELCGYLERNLKTFRQVLTSSTRRNVQNEKRTCRAYRAFAFVH